MGEVAPARAKGFNFCARKNDAGFDRFGDGEIVSSLPIVDFDRFQGA